MNIDYVSKKQIKDIGEFLKLMNSIFKVIGATNDMMRQALRINNNDLEDNLQYFCAKQNDCNMIVSNDKKFYSEDLKILSSFEFVNEYIKK